jgi:hypothetical protein
MNSMNIKNSFWTGRGSYGGGKYNIHVALQKIVENDLSVAIFAPAGLWNR